MRQLKLFIGRPSDKLPRDLLALGRKQCRLITRLLLTGNCTLRWHLHIMGLLEVPSAGKMDSRQNPPTIYAVNTQH
jgi:hypothetical protein